ncbi:MAG: eukaryotic-like serine/threonine-protein kinase [Acidobacteriota bacterium]|jgi:serine/threonine protein kinase|nr:eukaryotic-like serine/threonine-protein kinase [Acidobacteriota bacterium]
MMPSPTKTPTRLGRYEILDEIGKGAMGIVYLAKDPLIGRLVALKTFRIGYSLKDQEMEQFRARFMREAQSAGILSHPNIVTIHDVVEESEEGLAFIAMEYVRGTNLKMLLQRETSLDLAYVAGILEQIADGLDYAHSKGVVHRDVKPANIIITADNRAKITDFGIARIDTSNLTQEGQLLGTPNYMAPEQILGREVDHRADIFSLGVVLYEMLTRHKPFQGENLTVVSHRIVYDHFTPPKDYVANLPRGVEPILARVLDKEPGRRYQRASEMAADLSRLVSERLASESLNETLSLSSILPAPAVPTLPTLPPLPELPEVSAVPEAGMGTVSGSDSTISTVPPPPGAAVVPPAAAPRRSRLPRPLAPLLAGLALLLVAAVAAGWLWTEWRRPRPVAAPPFPKVVSAPAPAAPNPALLQQQQAAALAAEQERQAQKRKEIDDRLGQARESLAGRHYDAAVAAASAVLSLDPGNADAQGVLSAVDKAEKRRNDRAALAKAAVPPRPSPAQKLPPASLPTTTPTTSVVTPVPTEATLNVRFLVDDVADDGVLVVYVNDSQMMRESFDFRKKTGFLRSRPGKGTVEQPLKVPVGTANIRIYATYGNKRSEVKTLSGNFPGGAVRTLNATLTADGSFTARLE